MYIPSNALANEKVSLVVDDPQMQQPLPGHAWFDKDAVQLFVIGVITLTPVEYVPLGQLNESVFDPMVYMAVPGVTDPPFLGPPANSHVPVLAHLVAPYEIVPVLPHFKQFACPGDGWYVPGGHGAHTR